MIMFRFAAIAVTDFSPPLEYKLWDPSKPFEVEFFINGIVL